MPRVHTFDDKNDINLIQKKIDGRSIKDGDVVIIVGEKAVGVVISPWVSRITKHECEMECFFNNLEEDDWNEMTMIDSNKSYLESLRKAKREAELRGWETL